MSDLVKKSNSKEFSYAFVGGATDQEAAIIIPGKPGVQIVVDALDATGANASAVVKAGACTNGLETTTEVAANAAATQIDLNGDDDGYINGYQIANNDYMVVLTTATNAQNSRGADTALRALLISGATEDAANDAVDCTVAGLDGITGVEGAVAASAKAWIVRADRLTTHTVGSATIAKENVIAGEVGKAVVFIMDPGGAAAHDFSVSGRYV
jgi:hypothetical protein